MKNLLITLSLAASIILLTSCAMFTNKGKAAKAEEKSRAKIVNVENAQAANNVEKIDTIAGLAYGTDYALSKVNEPPREVTVARDINQRVISLSGSPTIEKMKEMQETIDKLTSQLATERDEGKVKMTAKDAEISTLQAKEKELSLAKESEIHKYMNAAQEAAANADAYKAEIDKMNSWFGLGAIWYGAKKFLFSSMWVLLGGSIIFLVLRMASFSNPIAASIFSIFTTMASWLINVIKVIVPKAVEAAGHVTTAMFDTYKSTLCKIVDGIQVVKDRAIASGQKPDLNLVLDEVAKTMNADEKQIVDEIKKALNWK
jgi:hypothetical protein